MIIIIIIAIIIIIISCICNTFSIANLTLSEQLFFCFFFPPK